MVLQYSIGCKNNHFLSIRPMESKKKLKYFKKNGYKPSHSLPRHFFHDKSAQKGVKSLQSVSDKGIFYTY